MNYLTVLPSEILVNKIGPWLGDRDWGNFRQCCSYLRDIFRVDSKFGPVIYGANSKIGDRGYRFIKMRKKPSLAIRKELIFMPSMPEFVMHIIENQAWKTAKHVLSAVPDWEKLLTVANEKHPAICKQLFQRYIYLCPDESIVTRFKHQMYQHKNLEAQFITNIDNEDECIALIRDGINLNFIFNNQLGCTTILNYVISADRLNLVRLLLSSGADVNFYDESGSSPIIQAAACDKIEIVKILLANGADVNHTNNDGSNALFTPCFEGFTEIVRLLINAGINVSHVNELRDTPLIRACRYNHLEIVELLLAAGANIDYHSPEFPNTALLTACTFGYFDVVKTLIDNNADIKLTTEDNFNIRLNELTPLSLASSNGHKNVVKLLIEAGANINYVNSHGHSALILARANQHYNIVELLLSAGANDN